jgi:hypothetical protein
MSHVFFKHAVGLALRRCQKLWKGHNGVITNASVAVMFPNEGLVGFMSLATKSSVSS